MSRVAHRIAQLESNQERLRANTEARTQAERWARKGIEVVEAGRIADAKKAHERAQRHLAKMTDFK